MSVALRRPARSISTDGFTLVELLVVITLLGLLISAIFGTVRFGTRAMDRTAAGADRRQEIEGTHRFLRRLLSETGGSADGDQSGGRAALVGDVGHLRVVASMPRHLATGGQAVVDLKTRQTSSGMALDAAWQPSFARPAIEVPIVTTTLAEVATVEFAYFGDPSGGGRASWHQAWTSADRLPALVRIAVTGVDTRRWPDLVVALPLAARAAQ
jgi:general secretion pathway protein J